MSKALVIKGANFSVNKVATVELEDQIPCTGISLSANTITFTEIGDTETLTATVTPADTTDEVVWISSNEDCATVLNGVVTCVGVGSATITVACGAQSATCTVTATHTVDADTAYHVENGARYSGSMDLSAGKNHIGRASDTRGRLYYSTVEFGTYRAFTNTAFDGQYVIPLPKGATKATITPPSEMRSYSYFVLANSNEKQTYVGGADGQAALGIYPYAMGTSAVYPYTIDFSDYAEEANGFIMSVRTAEGVDASAISGHTTITFS